MARPGKKRRACLLASVAAAAMRRTKKRAITVEADTPIAEVDTPVAEADTPIQWQLLNISSLLAKKKMMEELESILSSNATAKSQSIKVSTARQWLRKLGFRWRDVKKGVYIDGHE
ncbi:hypothetical protein BDZ91DRAFT_852386 [Kalaharituber pfeilii]|nr:hypothetical protein BDZ91DRAFT_852386 [Kalaharituber pfeilii]